ncbi:TraB/GumN family protein [Shimia sp.]|uniref:TraB/GumN family protein n=1 Tax=Shimia sp. TaxID=1954381 RepID=UPI0035675672
MIRILLVLLTLILPATAHAACSGPSQFEALAPEQQAALRDRAHQVPFARGVLWQIERGGVRSYVVGTLHLPDPRHAATLDRLAPLMPKADRLFLEMTTETEAAFMRDLTSDPSHYLMPAGTSLIEALGDEAWQGLLPHLKARGVPPVMAARYQPWFLGMTMSVSPCALRVLQSGQPGLDRLIERRALDLGLETRSLDSPEAMLATFSASPLDSQIDDLKQAIGAGTIDAEDTAALIALYFAGETQLAWDFSAHTVLTTAQRNGVSGMEGQLQRLEQDLLTDRNRQWLEILVAELRHAPAVVAVGALHLPGEQGLLAGLQRAGFTVERIEIRRD